jgi:hypothetical protein
MSWKTIPTNPDKRGRADEKNDLFSSFDNFFTEFIKRRNNHY